MNKMSVRFAFALLALIPAVSLLSGCKTVRQGTNQPIGIKTFPAGAEVVVDGESLGRTPLEIPLARKIPHQVLIRKDGYKDFVATVAPVRNQAGESYIRFGLLDEFGYYYDLDPNPVEIQLVPAVLPPSRGPNAYEEMTEVIAQVDQRRIDGEIGPVEHKYMVEKIVEFYTQ